MSTEHNISDPSGYKPTHSVVFAHPIALLEKDNEVMATAIRLMAQDRDKNKEAIQINYDKICANYVAIKLLKGEIKS